MELHPVPKIKPELIPAQALRFLKSVAGLSLSSQTAIKYQKRFERSGLKMFTFLEHDGVPWNNTNAEHAIKAFAKYRRDADGRFTESTLKDYLVLASVLETCAFNNVNVLKFLLSKSTTLDGLLRMAGRNIEPAASLPSVEGGQIRVPTEEKPEDSK